MIEAIACSYVGKSEGYLIIQADNFILRVVSDTDSFSTCKEGDKITVYTRLIVTQDDISIYGFDSKDKRNVFEKLIKVSKLGPKTAVKILSSTSIEFLSNAIASGDIEKLASIPGIGRKTAERIVMELRDEFEVTEVDDISMEAIEALVALGYSPVQARNAVKKVGKEEDVGKVIKEALKILSTV
ncbi:MAG: Holliday junction branch migration protein RuvA [Fervidobacterium sp.]